ncbi:hypothetical protein Q31b_08840 [Novipirellula aureliae]|uniref:Uncharacterized protein n=1 Tax=Novipirellula aureliae TaxID=2527966 RepID=A0A5C6EA25_9BACT|nr:hypothetical protein [Novipirellula aureliae]TWU45708.1 hypothetical protein Q31b_08840 [Novipirellula aureliae]
MRRSLLWLLWLVLPVFVLAYHYGPGQTWLARDKAATLIRKAQAQSASATAAQEAAYELHLDLLDARRASFAAGIDWQTQSDHPLARSVVDATARQDAAYDRAGDLWQQAADLYGQATETLLKEASSTSSRGIEIPATDRQLLESLRWAEARAMVRAGQVFNGIEQLQALLELRMVERTMNGRTKPTGHTSPTGHTLPTDAIREELAAAQYVGARLLREEGRPPEVWRPVSDAARQHYRYLASSEASPSDANLVALPSLDRGSQMQRNLEQVLNLEQSVSDQLEGVPLPRTAPLARRPGDGAPGEGKPGNNPGKGPPNTEGPPMNGAGMAGPMGSGW